jgi:dipeptidyl aminopeptidase/acylaminoacyl peptidase
MSHVYMKSLARRHRVAAVALTLVALCAAYALTVAQTPAKKVLGVEDYTKWRSIANEAISADGAWVTCVLQQTNTTPAESKPVLHVLNLETSKDVSVPDATGGTFSPDSKWIAYQVDPGAAQRARAARGGAGTAGASTPSAPSAPAPGATPPQGPPGQAPASQPPSTSSGQGGRGAPPPIPPRRVELRNLATGEVRSWQEIETFGFNSASTHLYLKRRAPESTGGSGGRGGGAPGAPEPGGPGGGRGGAAPIPTGPRGLDVLLVELASTHHQLLGSVGDIAFNRQGDLLAYTVDAPVKDANGLFVFDTRSGRTFTLDNDARQYFRLAWNEDGTAIAVLKGLDVEKMRERNNVLMAFPNVRATIGGTTTGGETPPTHVVLDPAKADGFPKGWVVSDRATLAWSEDNKRVFFGIKEQEPAADTTRRTTDEAANVDVWNSGDERIQSQQMVRADQERNFTFRQAFDVTAIRFLKLADETLRELDVAPDGKWAIGRDTRGYIHDDKPPAADIYRVNTATGERALIQKNQLIGAHVFGITPQGRHFVFWKDNKFQAYDLDAGTTKTLGAASPVSFVDMEYDHPGPKPSYGVAGFTSDGQAVLAQHRYDLWLVPLDGGAPRNLTNGIGAKNEIRFRYVRAEPVDPSVPRSVGPRGTIDLTKPITLSAYGEYTKKAGFYELANGQLKELVLEDAWFGSLTKAMKADRFLFTRQTFVDFPDLRVSGPGFKDSKKITDANPQQAEYLWGRRILFDYKTKDGIRLQGILAIPDDYKAGERRPMLVTFYEKNSQNLHRYNAPSYLTGMGASPMEAVTRGYLTMLADVHFHTGRSHSDMLECVEAATRKVIEMGYADPKRIGVSGHSYGGEGAAFIGVTSKMFAAVADGAGVTDLYNDFSQNWGWSYHYSGGSGANGNDYYLFGQGRWGFSPWDKPDVYRYESALTHVPQATAPILIMHGTSDPTVNFYNGLGFYNALRYNGKKAYLLAYQGEGHGLRGMANRKDLTVRYFEFFDHYLKGASAPKWMTEGVPFLKKDAKPEAAAK